MPPTPRQWIELLRSRAEKDPGFRIFTFLKDGERDELHLTYGDLDLRARAMGAYLQRLNAEGERVMLFYPPGLEYVVGFFGCLYAGAIPVPSYPPDPSRALRSLERLGPIVEDAGARFALAPSTVKWASRWIARGIPQLRGLHWLNEPALTRRWAGKWKDPRVSADAIAFLQYTSGSTGQPKGVMVSHGNLLHNVDKVGTRLKLNRNDRGLLWVPPYHDLGLIGGILQPVFSDFHMTLMSPVEFLRKPQRWLDAVTRLHATATGGPPFALDLTARRATDAELATIDLSSVRILFTGAEPVHATTLERFTARFKSRGLNPAAIYPTYGMAENTLMVGGDNDAEGYRVHTVDSAALEARIIKPAQPKDPGARSLVACGRLLPDSRVLAVDPETSAPCPPGRVGEIWISGPSVAKGYWRKPEITAMTFGARLSDGSGPFLRSGDLGYIHEERVYVTGRVKDLIILRGRNLYPYDIELTAVGSHPALRPGNAVAFSVPGDGEEKLVLVLEVRKGHAEAPSFNPAEVIQSVSSAVMRDHGARPADVVLIAQNTLPKTSSGKLQRNETRKRYLDGELDRVDAGGDEKPVSATSRLAEVGAAFGRKKRQDPLTEAAFELLSRLSALPVKEINENQKLVDDLGLDSLLLANLQVDVEAALPGVQLPTVDADTKVKDLLKALSAAAGRKTAGAAERLRLSAIQAGGLGATRMGEAPPPSGEIPEAFYKPEKFPEVAKLQARFAVIQEAGTANPYLQTHSGPARDTFEMGGKQVIHWAGYNYVAMSGDPQVQKAAHDAIDHYGTSASASRLASGQVPIHVELERELADFLGAEDSVVMVAGHPTNMTTIGHLAAPGDLILHDSLSHDSILQGCKLSGAQRRPFPHNDWEAADRILKSVRAHYRRVLLVTEGVFSMDGDVVDLPKFVEVKDRHKAMLYVDEAHSIGTLGKTGRGICEHWSVDPARVDILMGTLSKALASCGGYVAGSKALVSYLRYTAPAFVYSVGLPPPSTAASLEAVRLLKREPQRVQKLHANSKLFLDLARQAGLETGPAQGTPVVPIILGDSVLSLRLSDALARKGINVQPILYPAVPEEAARLRFFVTSAHTEEQIRQTVATTAAELARLKPEREKELREKPEAARAKEQARAGGAGATMQAAVSPRKSEDI
ncbi:MAG TPA: aminotransferase class I/II-fold pyridoxal phosphate-dependent enzyme [Bdellovibrionota bacterium]|nr:aminotransferase class I/II-fold pyridoxal phosphate-dependent enzyme [Bdellovibrionota bacterium]